MTRKKSRLWKEMRKAVSHVVGTAGKYPFIMIIFEDQSLPLVCEKVAEEILISF